MTETLRLNYVSALYLAHCNVEDNDTTGAMEALKAAMACANKSRDARYRRAVFRAMSFVRRLPTNA